MRPSHSVRSTCLHITPPAHSGAIHVYRRVSAAAIEAWTQLLFNAHSIASLISSSVAHYLTESCQLRCKCAGVWYRSQFLSRSVTIFVTDNQPLISERMDGSRMVRLIPPNVCLDIGITVFIVDNLSPNPFKGTFLTERESHAHSITAVVHSWSHCSHHISCPLNWSEMDPTFIVGPPLHLGHLIQSSPVLPFGRGIQPIVHSERTTSCR